MHAARFDIIHKKYDHDVRICKFECRRRTDENEVQPRNDVIEWSGKERENKRGSITDPCKTPVYNESVDDEMLPVLTKLVLAVQYNLIQFNAVPVTPKVSKSLLRRTA